jgi:hypothetical protein
MRVRIGALVAGVAAVVSVAGFARPASADPLPLPINPLLIPGAVTTCVGNGLGRPTDFAWVSYWVLYATPEYLQGNTAVCAF